MVNAILQSKVTFLLKLFHCNFKFKVLSTLDYVKNETQFNAIKVHSTDGATFFTTLETFIKDC